MAVTLPYVGDAPTGPAGGDLSSTYPDPVVSKIRGKNVPAPGAGQDEQGFVYDHDTGAFVWTDFATQAELNTHKTSSDHDSRYYTETEVDSAFTANALSDRARANHTGTQLSSTISDIVEKIQDEVGAFFLDSASVDVTYDDVANAISAILANNAADNTKLADMAQSTIKGRAAGASTGDPTDLTAAQVKTILAIVAADISNLDAAISVWASAFQARITSNVTPTAYAAHHVLGNVWTEDFDTNSVFSPTTGKYIPTVAGWYELSTHLYTTDPDDQQYVMPTVWRNGALLDRAEISRASTTGGADEGFHGSVMTQSDGNDEFQMGYFLGGASGQIGTFTIFGGKRVA